MRISLDVVATEELGLTTTCLGDRLDETMVEGSGSCGLRLITILHGGESIGTYLQTGVNNSGCEKGCTKSTIWTSRAVFAKKAQESTGKDKGFFFERPWMHGENQENWKKK